MGRASLANPLDDGLGYLLRRAAVAAGITLTAALEHTGLRAGEAALLRLIGANPGAPQSALARSQRAKPANLVPLVARLETLGLIARQAGRGRAIGLALTDAGEAMLREVEAATAAHEARLARSIPPDARAAMAAALRAMTCDAFGVGEA